VPNTQGLPIQIVRSDHGFELKAEFIELYDLLGISHDFSPPRTPQ